MYCSSVNGRDNTTNLLQNCTINKKPIRLKLVTSSKHRLLSSKSSNLNYKNLYDINITSQASSCRKPEFTNRQTYKQTDYNMADETKA